MISVAGFTMNSFNSTAKFVATAVFAGLVSVALSSDAEATNGHNRWLSGSDGDSYKLGGSDSGPKSKEFESPYERRNQQGGGGGLGGGSSRKSRNSGFQGSTGYKGTTSNNGSVSTTGDSPSYPSVKGTKGKSYTRGSKRGSYSNKGGRGMPSWNSCSYVCYNPPGMPGKGSPWRGGRPGGSPWDGGGPGGGPWGGGGPGGGGGPWGGGGPGGGYCGPDTPPTTGVPESSSWLAFAAVAVALGFVSVRKKPEAAGLQGEA